MMTLEALATLALKTLDMQQRYFKTRTLEDLKASKELERELRRMATLALAPAEQTTIHLGGIDRE
jgi:hypothetical protein